MRRHALFFAIFLSAASTVSATFISKAQAFPELIRHGYVNCTTCHVSPTGGGTITDYGRTFSGEGLSTWTSKNEESLFHGLVKRKKIPSWLAIGGDIRAVQVWQDNDKLQRAESIMMQADFEAAVTVKKLTVDASFGRFQTAQEEPRPKSRRYFVMYNFTDQIAVRAGRYLPGYGINLPDHIISTRAPLGFNQGNETYNVELSLNTDSWSAMLAGLQGPIDSPTSSQETGGFGQLAYAFKDTYKIGANYFYANSDKQTRQIEGLYALLGFTPALYYLGEYDMQNTSPKSGASTQGFFTYNRFGYEIKRGVHLLLTGEYWQTDVTSNSSANDRYGVGTELFPRPHFDIQAIWTKNRQRSNGPNFEDYAWAIFHYYF